MSRVGKKPIPVSKGVEVRVDGGVVRVKGPKGELSYSVPSCLTVKLEKDSVVVERASEERKVKALHGLARSLIANMIRGVSEGYEKALELEGVGYRASKSGDKLVLAVGYSKPVEIAPAPGIQIEVPKPSTIVVKGPDKQLVGQVAANIRKVRPPEPYQGKGIRYAGEKIRRKAGKTGKK